MRKRSRFSIGPDADRLKLGDFLDEGGYTQEFREFYLYPMAAAVWSSAPSSLREFPAAMLVRFFDNHGMLTVNGHPQWKTIPGGCSRYIEPITKPFRDRMTSGVEIAKVTRYPGGVVVEFCRRRAAGDDVRSRRVRDSWRSSAAAAGGRERCGARCVPAFRDEPQRRRAAHR